MIDREQPRLPGRDQRDIANSGVNHNRQNEPRLQKSKPRDIRCLRALVDHPEGVMRRDLDRLVGTTNSGQYVLHRRMEGWDVVTERVKEIDRDGRITMPGRYYLSPAHRAIALKILGGE